MKHAKLGLVLLFVTSLSACSATEKIKAMDRQIDTLDRQIDEIEAKPDRGPVDEVELDRLYAARNQAQEDRDKEAEKINTGTSIGKTLLGGLGIILGVPLLIGIGSAVGKIRIPKRGKRPRKK